MDAAVAGGARVLKGTLRGVVTEAADGGQGEGGQRVTGIDVGGEVVPASKVGTEAGPRQGTGGRMCAQR